MMQPSLNRLKICIKGAGEMASGVACRLYASGFRQLVMLETAHPLAVRRKVSFCEAVYEGSQTVEAIKALKVNNVREAKETWDKNQIAVCVDPSWKILNDLKPDVLIDAILAKRNIGTHLNEASLVIGLGPGFTAGKDVHCVIETNRGHNLGRIIRNGSAESNTGIPGAIGQYTTERVLRAPIYGIFYSCKLIGDQVTKGTKIGNVEGQPVLTEIDGVIRGLIRDNTIVTKGLKIGDVDPRGEISYCNTVSEKARAIGGSVLEAILAKYNKP